MQLKFAAIIKILVPIAIIIWLFYRVKNNHPEALTTLSSTEKNWSLLIASVATVFLAVLISFLRWHLLMTTIDIPIRLRDTLRLGFLGYLMSFVAPGQVGGDLFKAVFVAREHRGKRATAIATILIDRICGVYGLLVIASIGLYMSQFSALSTELRVIATSTYALTAVCTVVFLFAMIPGIAESRVAKSTIRIPMVGGICAKLLAALTMYQQKKYVLAIIGLLSVGVHLLLAIAVFMAAKSLYLGIPSLFDHLVISPIAGLVGSLPISPGGLGSYEMAMTYMYDLLSDPTQQGRGFVVGLCYRMTSLLVAAIGLGFYWTGKSEVEQVMDDVNEAITA